MKKTFITIVTLTITIMCFTTVAKADSIFTKQPKSATADINNDITLTWETSRNDCSFMLQQRDGENYEWGNVEEVTSPHKINYPMDIEFQYRIMALCGSNQQEYYSNVINAKWVLPDNLTTAEIADIRLGDLPLGYSNDKTYPVSITNTGNHEIISPKIVLGGGEAYYDVIQNKKPHNIKPGETDNTTFSIKLKKGLGINYYNTGIYLEAENVQNGAGGTLEFWVVESNVEITYDAEVNSIDFGTLESGYKTPEDQVLTVRATGTGNLTHVRMVRGEDEPTFFDVQIINPTLDTLGAGTTSGNNWYVRLRSGLEPGEYKATLKFYADEISEPVIATVTAIVLGEDGETPEVITVGADTEKSKKSTDGKNDYTIIIVGVVTFLALGAGAACIFINNKKKNETKSTNE